MQFPYQRLAARFSGLQGDGKLFFGLRLADEFAELARTQFQIEALLLVGRRGAD
jgi:hypothetical protein